MRLFRRSLFAIQRVEVWFAMAGLVASGSESTGRNTSAFFMPAPQAWRLPLVRIARHATNKAWHYLHPHY